MNKQKIILTDADGVLMDWNSAFAAYMANLGLPQLPNTDTEYSISARHGISVKHAMARVKEFNEGPYIRTLKPFADAQEYVKKLADLGFRFIVVTSISNTPSAKYHRIENAKDLFGDVFDEINCIELGASKASILMNWADTGYFWIEDHMRQAEAGHEAGLKTVLINHPYNTHYKTDLFPIVSNKTPWKEIYDMVCKEYKLNQYAETSTHSTSTQQTAVLPVVHA